MASPFKVFRKNQKLMLAILAILAMVAFVIIPNLGKVFEGNGRSRAAEVAVTTKYGDFNEQQLQNMRDFRDRLFRFLTDIQIEAAAPGLRASPEFRQIAGQLQLRARARRVLAAILGDAGDLNDEAVVDTWILARQAEELGIEVTDETVTKSLQVLSNDRLPYNSADPNKPGMRQLLKENGLTERDLFQQMRMVLLAAALRTTFDKSLDPRGTPPAQRWDYFRRINRTVDAEVLPVSTEQFMNEISDPGEAALEEFFRRYKDRAAEPDSPEFGFKEPYKVSVEYVRVGVDDFYDPSSVTEAEIQQYEEEEKARQEREAAKEAAKTKPAEKEKPAEKVKPEQEAKPAEKAKPGETETAKPATPKEEPAAKSPPPAASKDAETKPGPAGKPEEADGPAQPGPEKAAPAAKEGGSGPTSEKEAAPPPASKGDPQDPAESSREPALGGHQIQFVSFQEGEADAESAPAPAGSEEPKKQEEEEGAAPAAIQQPTPASQGGAAAPGTKAEASEPKPEPPAEAPETAAGAKEKSAPPESAGEEAPATKLPIPAEKETPSPGAGPSPGKSEPSPAEAKEAPKEPPTPPHTRLPLPGLGPELRNPLLPQSEYKLPALGTKPDPRKAVARGKARARMEEVLNDIDGVMNAYTRKYTKEYQVAKEDNPDAVPPPRPDLQHVAAQYGVAYGDTGMISELEPGHSDILDAYLGWESFREFIFNPGSAQIFEPKRATKTRGAPSAKADWVYLFWKIEERESYVPEFSEVRDKVLADWKLREARQLALAKARDLAREIPTGPEVREVNLVSWNWAPWQRMARIPIQDHPREQIIAGPEFMQTLNDLGFGEIGVAMNYPKTVAYVIRVLSRTGETPESLQREFREGWKAVVTQRSDAGTEKVRDDFDAAYAFDSLRLEIRQAWLEQRRAEAQLHWNRPPREVKQRD